MRFIYLRNAVLACLIVLSASLISSGEQIPVEQTLARAEAEFRQQHYKQAVRLLEQQLQLSPNDRNLRLELGRAYLYDHRDQPAIQIFREILRDEPSNRVAKLELARASGYQGDYESSNRLYRDLLTDNPDDESASVGLVRNLLHQNKTIDARQELTQALAHHPESTRLRELKSRLDHHRTENAISENQRNRLQASETYFTDSASNRLLRSRQQLDTVIVRGLASRLQTEERSLWVSGGAKANVLSGTEGLRLRLNRFLLVDAGGGVVRFADHNTRALYRGELEANPWKRLRLIGGFSRVPISPTFASTQFNLLAEGWYARADWDSNEWRVNLQWSHQHYSDHNLARREGGELVRWFGGPHTAFAAGYQFNHLNFSQNLTHGYFDPSTYQSHLAVAGIRFRFKNFRGEYISRIGGETISAGPYNPAWELSLRNFATFGKLELGPDYSYFHLAQNTGAFKSHMLRILAVYRF